MRRPPQKLSDAEIEKQWKIIQEEYEKNLKPYGVKPIRLKSKATYTKDALVLIYLSWGYPNTSWITKEELTSLIREHFPSTPDVQQARHLGSQKGYYVLSTKRGNCIDEEIPPDIQGKPVYKLKTLEEPHPNFVPQRRRKEVDLGSLKAKYNNRCATCGSEEGKPNPRYPQFITQIQAGHMNPNKPLDESNAIPQCQFCNRADRNWWVYDERGRVVGIASAEVVRRSIKKGFLSEEEQEKIRTILKLDREESP